MANGSPNVRIAAIDQGTTSTRALLFDGGSARIVHAVGHRQHYPHPGWVEHNPLELLQNVRNCISRCGPVDAIGIGNQGESCLAWDAETGVPLSPVIVWQDNRTRAVINDMKAQGFEVETLRRSGLPLDPYFSASKLRWILDHIPDASAALQHGRLRLGTTDAFFLHHLTGAGTTDPSTASRTGLMNIETCDWDNELCRLFGIPIGCLPEIRETTGMRGLIKGASLTCSIVDQQASLFGHGCRKLGDTKITFGTGAFVMAVTESGIIRADGEGLLPTIAWRNSHSTTYAVDGGVYDAGSAIEWAGRLGLYSNFQDLNAFDQPPAISRRLVFVPSLSGLGCPYWDRSAAGLWIGMSAETTRLDLCQSILEGVALRTAEVIDTFDHHISIGSSLSIDGGLSRSDYFCQFMADVIGRDITTRTLDELTSLGIAGLAAKGLGISIDTETGIAKRYTPNSHNDVAAYRTRFADAVTRCRNWRADAATVSPGFAQT